jgi:hypothetical protein
MLIFAILVCVGCANTGSTIGDGKVDAVEAATIKLAVGAVMTAKPEIVTPAYTVSTALLAVMDGTEITSLSIISDALDEKIEDLGLSPADRTSFLDLVNLVTAKISAELNLSETDLSDKIVVVKTMLEIVQTAAKDRM